MPVLECGVAKLRPCAYTAHSWKAVEQFWCLCARIIVGVPRRTSKEAYMGDLGWRPFWTRAAWQARSMWTRITEMQDSELPRKAMHEQFLLIARNVPCWLRSLRNTLQRSELGIDKWHAWVSVDDFRVQCVERRQLNSSVMCNVRWEEDLRVQFEADADAEWLQAVSTLDTRSRQHSGLTWTPQNKLRTYAN